MRALRLIARGFWQLIRALVAAAILLREVVASLGAPLWRLIARLRLLTWLSAWVQKLPPWGVVSALVSTLVIAEPPKLIGLYLLATGHVLSGTLMLGSGYAISLILAERIMHAGNAQLMSYCWFALASTWLADFRRYVLSRPLIEAARQWGSSVRQNVRDFLAALRQG